MAELSAIPFGRESSTLEASRPAPVVLDFMPREESSHTSVLELITAQAELAPQALAVRHGTHSLTYEELEQRANTLANRLRLLGVGPDVVVGIYLNRSFAMIVGALAIMKAGGAYLPLDPNYPAERLAFMLNDAATNIVVTSKCMLEKLPVQPERAVILECDGMCEGFPAVEKIIASPEPNNLAYVIYTSGSTGQPKGVELTHGGLLNLVFWHQRVFGVTAADRASQLSALGFDAAVWEIWPYLTAGASVHLPECLAVNQPEAVRDWLLSEGITITFLATPLAERALTLDWPTKSSLRTMLTGADTLHHYPPRKLRFQLVNNYGPTECTVVATSGTVLPNEHPDRLPPIGRPIDNAVVRILDEQMRPVAPGEAGEIYVGGAGLARGYRNRPDLTAEKFVLDPFSTDPGARLYKTGDLGRYLPDGQIAFLGRADEQIKVRGFRIEPAEIIKALDEHPAVQASMVIAREVTAGDKHLVAYFVPASKAQLTHTELRNFVSARVPEYMVPAIFVKLDALPLNASCKVDRAALPAPTAENTLRDDRFVAPRTPTEERLAAMLAPLLDLSQVSVEDNFFLLGGHSLLGTQLIARVRDAFGIEISLRSLFDAPTVAKLASKIEELLIAKLEAMSEAEAERLLANSSPAQNRKSL